MKNISQKDNPKALILCGGKGIRLDGNNEFLPKAMVKIGSRPILWHVMKILSRYGINEFVLALGSGGEKIRRYFLEYNTNENDISFYLKNKEIVQETSHQEDDWKLTFVDTGDTAGTGARIFRCKKYLEGKFIIVYADCLANVNIGKLLQYHEKSGKLLTVTGVCPPFRYGEFVIKKGVPIDHKEMSRLRSSDGAVNGGFMVAEQGLFKYLNAFDECALEKEVFTHLVSDKKLAIYQHDGFWQCLDNDREYRYLNDLCTKNQEYWIND